MGLAEDQNSIPNTHVGWLTDLQLMSTELNRDPMPLASGGVHTHVCTDTYPWFNIIKINLKKKTAKLNISRNCFQGAWAVTGLHSSCWTQESVQSVSRRPFSPGT